MAADVFLEDLSNCFQIVGVHVSAQAAFAADFLAGEAKTMYSTRASAARLAGKTVDMQFFRTTLRSVYVPIDQGARAFQRSCQARGCWASQRVRRPLGRAGPAIV
jgi:hypothetical protein